MVAKWMNQRREYQGRVSVASAQSLRKRVWANDSTATAFQAASTVLPSGGLAVPGAGPRSTRRTISKSPIRAATPMTAMTATPMLWIDVGRHEVEEGQRRAVDGFVDGVHERRQQPDQGGRRRRRRRLCEVARDWARWVRS